MRIHQTHPARAGRWYHAIWGAWGLLLIFAAPASSQVQAPLEKTPEKAPEKVPAEAQYLGPTRCADCHGAANPLRSRDFVLQTEFAHFRDADKHFQAFELLKGELGQAIARRLGIADVAEAQQCLSCHSNWLKDQAKVPNSEFGVTCESCHGPSSLWDLRHSLPAWRLLSPVEKSKLGLIDVRHPVTRAEQCFACHIGNAEQGKVITHEMYAAGHPPLPSIEVESFIDQMPAHWRYLPEKGPFESRAEYIKLNSPRTPAAAAGDPPSDLGNDLSNDLPRTRSAIVSGMVALRESLELFSSQARPDNPQWPELAAFDCQACHHDLRAPSWRQQREGQFAPGRPALPEWPFALVKVGLRQIAAADEREFSRLTDEFSALRQKLNASIQRQPFGDKHAAAHAVELAKWLEPQIATLAASRYDRESAQRAILELSNLGPREYPDFHTARQLAWALGIIQREVDVPYPQWPVEAPAKSAAERRQREARAISIFETWRDKSYAPQRAAWAARWKLPSPQFELPLLLPSGQQQVIENTLPQSLNAISNYDAAIFRKLMETVHTQQPAAPPK